MNVSSKVDINMHNINNNHNIYNTRVNVPKYYISYNAECIPPTEKRHSADYEFNVKRFIQAIQTIQIDAVMIPEQIVIPVSKSIKIECSEHDNIDISSHMCRRINQSQIDVVLKQLNNLSFEDKQRYQIMFIIKPNGANSKKDIIYNYIASENDSIQYMDEIQLATAEKINAYYTNGCGQHNLLTQLFIFFKSYNINNTVFGYSILFTRLTDIVNSINQNKIKKDKVVLNCIIIYFIENDIDLSYFYLKLKTKRLEFINMLKEYCDIKTCCAQTIFAELYKPVSTTQSAFSEKQPMQHYTLSQVDEILQQTDQTAMKQMKPHLSRSDKYILKNNSQHASDYHSETEIRNPKELNCNSNGIDFQHYMQYTNDLLDYDIHGLLNTKYVDMFINENAFNFDFNMNISLYSNILTILMIIMVDLVHLITSNHVYRFINLPNVMKTTYDGMLKQTYNILETPFKGNFIPSTEKTNAVISHGADTNNGSNSSGQKSNTSNSGSREQSNTQASNNNTSGGGSSSGSGSGGASSSGSSGGNGNGNGNGNDKHNDDYSGKKEDNDKNKQDTVEHDENKDEEKKTSKSECTLDADAPEFEPISLKMTNRLDPIEEGDDSMAPGSVAISVKFTTEIIPNVIQQKLKNVYWFMNKSLSLQQIKYATEENVGVINYGFTDRHNNKLYCVVEPHEVTSDKRHKWRMVEDLFTKSEIEQKYKIPEHKLPKSFRNDDMFRQQIEHINIIKRKMKIEATKSILNATKWTKIPIINRKNNKLRTTLSITKNEFKKKLKTFCANKTNEIIELIPILLFDHNNNYHVEYIWIVSIENNDIGISIKYSSENQCIKIAGIYLDKQFILNPHQLICPQLQHASTCKCLDTFNSNINDLYIGNVNEQKNQNKQLRKENTELKHRINELENKIQIESIAVPIPCDEKYVFYKSKLYQCKELIKLLANKVNEQELKTKAFELLEKDLITDDDSKSDEYKSVNDDFVLANQQSKITSDYELQEQKYTEISPHHECAKNIEITSLNEVVMPNIYLNNPTSLFLSKSQQTQFSATTDISSNNNITTQSAPNPGLDAQFIDHILSGQQSTMFPYPYYIPITTLPLFDPYIQPPTPQWPIYSNNNNPFYTQQTVPMIPKIVPQTINMSYPLPTLPPTEPNIFELRNLPTQKINVFISKAMTTNSLTQIEEIFTNTQMLFYYLTHTVNMQIYNQCAKQFDDGSIIVNLDLNAKTTRNKLYAIIEKNNAANKNKYKWKLNQILEDATILNSNAYHILCHQLPISFRDSLNLYIDTQFILSTVNNMKLKSLYIVKNKSRSDKQSVKLSVCMTVDDLRKCIRESIDKQNELIPIVRFKDTKYWVEFILICETKKDKFNFGVSFKYESAQIQPTSIFVDRFDIERQNMLTGNKFLSHTLRKYKSGIKDINIIEHCA